MQDPAAETTPPKRRRRWPRRLAIGGAITFLVIILAAFFVAPPIARSVAQKQLGELLGRRVSIARIRINPLNLSLTVEGFQIFEDDGATPFASFSRLYVNAQLSSVFRGAPVIQEVALESLHVHVLRVKATPEAFADVDAAYNFSDILARLAAMPKKTEPEPPPKPDAPPPRFSLNNLHLTDGAVIFDDLTTGDHHEITGLTIGVPFASTLPVYLDSFVEPGLRVNIDGTTFVAQGRTKPFKETLETVLELRLQALDLTRYLPFVPLKLPFAVESARLSLALDVGFSRGADDAPKLTLKGTVGLDDLDVKEKHKTGPRPLLALKKLDIAIGESDLGAQRFHVEKVVIAGLQVHAVREQDGTFNFEHMLPAPEPKPETRAERREERVERDKEREKEREAEREKEKEREKERHEKHPKHEQPEGPRFTVDHFALEDATIHFIDDAVTPPFETTVRDFSITVRGLSNAPGEAARETVRLRVAPGLALTQEGTLRLTPLEAKGKLKLEGVEPAQFSTYYRNLIAFDVEKARLGLGADYFFEDAHGRQTVRITDAFVDLEGVALRRRGAGNDFFQLGGLDIKGADVDLAAHTVKVAAVATHDGHVRAARDAKGVVDLSTLVPPTAPAHGGASPAHAAPATPDEPETPWTVTLARFDLDGWSARFDDRAITPGATITLDPIALHLTNVSTAPGAKLGVDLRIGINKSGKLAVTGASTLPPVTANVRFNLQALEILPLQPYFQDQVSLAVTNGTVSLKGQAAVKLPAGTAPPQIDVTTDVDIADLATVDRDKKEALLKWKSFHVGALHAVTPPLAVSIDDVSLTDFETRLILFPDARFNLQDALAAPGAAPPASTSAPKGKAAAATTAEAPAAPPPPLSIKRVTLQGGQIAFRDRMIHPSYSADLTDLAGRITGLSTKPDSTADVDLRGSVNRSGVLTIVGTANPLAKDLTLDVAVNLKDFELPPTSPYTGKYAGYAISKGKLDLSLAYKIDHGKLDARNELVLDQLTFGDKIDSPTAMKLPLKLAIALLKDRHGVIDVNLPIAGSLADPDFKIGHAVWKVFENLLVKAVTEPFALIASAFGGGDDVSKIAFAPGTFTLDATAQKRLGVVVKVLHERPGVAFEIGGEADPKHEREELRRYLYERKLKAKRIAELVQAGAPVPAIDALTLAPADRPRLIAAAYKSETFPKPTNGIGLEKSLPPEEMEKLMLVNTNVDDDQLRALAQKRAQAVQNVLSKDVLGAAGRLYLVAPQLGTSGGRVELKLKKD